MARIRIKFCGITRAVDAAAAVGLGVDALGFVFYPPSPRAVSPALARDIIAGLPPFVTTVGLFVNASTAEVEQTVMHTGIDVVQFHGDETPAACSAVSRRWIKAIPVRAGEDVTATVATYEGASGILLDTYDPVLYGGTGAVFDWTLIPPELASGLILAGGLDAANVAAAISQTRPYGVDVSGGIESAKGIKDYAKMMQFVTEVRKCERSA